jgi:hypothetical protein
MMGGGGAAGLPKFTPCAGQALVPNSAVTAVRPTVSVSAQERIVRHIAKAEKLRTDLDQLICYDKFDTF